jgi:ABC-type transport system substrate-binding protein
VPEVSARIAELETGNADVITSVPPFLVGRVKMAPRATVYPMATGRAMWIYINTLGEGPLKNKKVRQAMNYAIDRNAIIKSIMMGSAAPSAAGLTPLHFGYDPSLKPYPYDPAMAKKLLAEAGYPNGFKVEFNTPNGKYLMDKEVSEAVAKMLNAVGIQTDLKVLEWGTHMQTIMGKKVKDLAFIGFGNVLFDADATLSFFYNPDSAGSYFSSPSLTDKIAKARSTMDPKKRLAIYKEIQAELYDEAPMIYLYQQLDNYGSSKTLKGLEIIDEFFLFKNVTK